MGRVRFRCGARGGIAVGCVHESAPRAVDLARGRHKRPVGVRTLTQVTILTTPSAHPCRAGAAGAIPRSARVDWFRSGTVFWRFLTGTARNIPAARCGRAGEPRAGTPGIKCANWRIGLPARGGGLNRAAAIPRSALSRRHPRGRDFDAARDIHPPAAGPSWAPRPCGDPRAPIAATPPETQ